MFVKQKSGNINKRSQTPSFGDLASFVIVVPSLISSLLHSIIFLYFFSKMFGEKENNFYLCNVAC